MHTRWPVRASPVVVHGPFRQMRQDSAGKVDGGGSTCGPAVQKPGLGCSADESMPVMLLAGRSGRPRPRRRDACASVSRRSQTGGDVAWSPGRPSGLPTRPSSTTCCQARSNKRLHGDPGAPGEHRRPRLPPERRSRDRPPVAERRLAPPGSPARLQFRRRDRAGKCHAGGTLGSRISRRPRTAGTRRRGPDASATAAAGCGRRRRRPTGCGARRGRGRRRCPGTGCRSRRPPDAPS